MVVNQSMWLGKCYPVFYFQKTQKTDVRQLHIDEFFLNLCSARHEGDLIPAKLKPSHGVAYVAYGGGEHGKSDYEVLVGCRPQWIRAQGSSVPPQAVPGIINTVFYEVHNHLLRFYTVN